MDTRQRQVTIADYEAIVSDPAHADRRFELVHGELVEKMPTQLHGLLVAFFIIEIGLYLRRNPLGRVMTEVRFQPPGQQMNARIPDVAFVRSEAGPVVVQGATPYLPDLAVEIQSPDQSEDALREKAAFYLAHGTRAVWLVYPAARRVEVITPEGRVSLGEGDVIAGGEVLPGFALPVRDVFASA